MVRGSDRLHRHTSKSRAHFVENLVDSSQHSNQLDCREPFHGTKELHELQLSLEYPKETGKRIGTRPLPVQGYIFSKHSNATTEVHCPTIPASACRAGVHFLPAQRQAVVPHAPRI
jgi:hypothetical protein